MLNLAKYLKVNLAKYLKVKKKTLTVLIDN